jgi:hypothetical protein
MLAPQWDQLRLAGANLSAVGSIVSSRKVSTPMVRLADVCRLVEYFAFQIAVCLVKTKNLGVVSNMYCFLL